MSYLRRIQTGSAIAIASARLNEGDILLSMGDRIAAEKAWEEALQVVPQSEEPGLRLISMSALLRKPLDVRRRLAEIRSRRPLSLAEMALWITADGRLTPFDEAEKRLTLFLNRDDSDEDAECALCIYLAEDGRTNEAILRLNDFRKRHGVTRRCRFTEADLLLRSGRISEAMTALEGIVPGQKATTAEEWETLGRAAMECGDVESACEALLYAESGLPFRRSAAYASFQALFKAGREREANIRQHRVDLLNMLHAEVEKVGISVVRGKKDTDALYLVAECLVDLHSSAEAAEWIRQIQRVDGEASRLLRLTDRLNMISDSTDAAAIPPQTWTMPSVSGTRDQNRDAADSAVRIRLTIAPPQPRMKYENGHTGLKYLLESMGGGVGVIDFDNDTWPDLYCPQGGQLGDGPLLPPMSDRLFRNVAATELRDATDTAGIREESYSLGVAAGDLNNDGFDDLAITNLGRNTVYQNCGDGTFLDITVDSGISETSNMSSGAAAADLDGDGDLDVYIVNYVDGLRTCRDDKGNIATCNPSVHAPVTDELWENEGNGRFRNISATYFEGIQPGKGLGVVTAQLNDDLMPDVFVTNDTTPNLLLINTSRGCPPQCEDHSFRAGVAVNPVGLAEAGMGIACGDFNHDARLDLYVTNFHREANSFLIRRSDNGFDDRTAAAGLREPTLPMLGFGTQAVDFDLDGWSELFVANGHIDDQTDVGSPWKMPSQLFRTADGITWRDVSAEVGGILNAQALGRGVAVWDGNRDGLPDLAVGFQDKPVEWLVNESVQHGNHLTLRLRGTRSNRNGYNALIFWTAQDGRTQVTELRAGGGYCSTSESTAILGIGNLSAIEMIRIQWPSGETDELSDLSANRRYVVVERCGVFADDVR
ncbi:MAG: CRTAC1 family protein [Planctomycetaceae bacterium]|nr:CRTAC1 family protein [Planctomycetaceae bacterium]